MKYVAVFLKLHVVLDHLMRACWTHALDHVLKFKLLLSTRTAGYGAHITQPTFDDLDTLLGRYVGLSLVHSQLFACVITPSRALI